MKMKKKYERPTLTKVVLNPAQAVLSVCSHASAVPNKAGGTGNTCKSSSPPATKCMKLSPAAGDSAAAC